MSSSPAARRGLLIVVSAPSGPGKTTLVDRLAARCEGLVRSRSYTSRPARPGEQDGVDYNFVSRETFEAMAGRGVVISMTENYRNTSYGEPIVALKSYILSPFDDEENIEVLVQKILEARLHVPAG